MTSPKTRFPLLDLTPPDAEDNPVGMVRYAEGRLMKGQEPYTLMKLPPHIAPILSWTKKLKGADHRVGLILKERFKITRILARGGMSSVYVAEDLKSGEEVAIKFLEKRHFDSSEEAEARFKAEAMVVSKLEDDRILKALAHGRTDNGELYIVTELLQGITLREALERHVRLNEIRVVQILIDLCHALSKAHAMGVVHRDLNPGNVFLVRTEDGLESARVLDFGIAKLTRSCTFARWLPMPATQSGAILGTPGYMAPEQVRGEAITGQADLYSLGILAYQCLTGQLPYNVGGLAILAAPLFKKPVPLKESAVDIEIHPSLDALIMRLISKDSKDRPQSAGEVRGQLEKIAASLKRTAFTRDRTPVAFSRRKRPRKATGPAWWSFVRRFFEERDRSLPTSNTDRNVQYVEQNGG